MTACRQSPPAKYARKGATRRTDYAYPQCWKYPVDTPAHTRAAASYFARFGHRIPAASRQQVAARIERAKRRFGIGPYRTNPGEAKMSAKDAKIRGHRLALQNALSRGDQKAAKEQRAALRHLGASVPRGGSSGGKRSTKGMKRNPSAGKVRVVKMKSNPSRGRPSAAKRPVRGYRRNPEDPLFDAAVKLREAEEAEERAAAEAARAAQEAAAKGTEAAAKKAEKAAEKAEKAADKVEKAAEKVEAKAATKKPRKPRKGGGSTKTMAKRTKKSRSEAGKKAARTRKRNARKAAGGASAPKKARKSTGSKGRPRKGTKAYYAWMGRKGAAARKRKARAAGGGSSSTTTRKSGGRKGKRHNRGHGLPKGFRKIDTKSITRARKGREVRTIVKYRKYKSNPLGDAAKVAMLAGGVAIGLVASDMLRRFVATMAPKGSKKPLYGTPASERTSLAPDAKQLGAQLGLAALFGLGAYASRKKSPGAMTFLGGAAIGAGGLALLEVINYFVMPKVLPSNNISEEKLGNRLYVFEQKYSQDYIRDDVKKQNDALAAGKTVNPDGGTVSGVRGGSVGALPAAPAHRALPPPARAGVVGQPAAQGNSVGAPPSNSVGCGGGGCGGGCTGGRNCGCAACSGGMSEALAPPGGANGGYGGYGRSGASNGTVTAPRASMPSASSGMPTTPARGNVNGPRQLGAAPVAFLPSRSAPRVAIR